MSGAARRFRRAKLYNGLRRVLTRGPRDVLRNSAASIALRLLRTVHGLPSKPLRAFVPASVGTLGQPILDDISMPPYRGSTLHDDLSAVLEFVRWKEPCLIVEFGTAHGNLVANMLRQSPPAGSTPSTR